MIRRLLSAAVIVVLLSAASAAAAPLASDRQGSDNLHSITGLKPGGVLLRARNLRSGDQSERHAPPVGLVPPSFAIQPPANHALRLGTGVGAHEHALTSDRVPRGPPLFL